MLFCCVAFLAAGISRADVRARAAGRRRSRRRSFGSAQGSERLFSVPAEQDARRVGQARERVRRQVLVATGLWPMPTAMPANAVVHGKVERDGFTVERVILESYPGHFVSGSLYRPVGKSGRFPAVLFPHGHSTNGRFTDLGVDVARKEIAAGAERFENGGRCVIPPAA